MRSTLDGGNRTVPSLDDLTGDLRDRFYTIVGSSRDIIDGDDTPR
jgi:hypothetical protein